MSTIKDVAFWAVIAINGQLVALLSHDPWERLVGVVMCLFGLGFLGWGKQAPIKVRVTPEPVVMLKSDGSRMNEVLLKAMQLKEPPARAEKPEEMS